MTFQQGGQGITGPLCSTESPVISSENSRFNWILVLVVITIMDTSMVIHTMVEL